MLTKKDIIAIDEVSNKNAKQAVTEGLMEFWEKMLEPYLSSQFEKNDKEHGEMVKEIKGLKKDVQGLQVETTEIKEYIKDHDNKIKALERVVSIKN